MQLTLDGTPEPQELPEPADPRVVACPDCGAKEGRYCKRPSGHKAMGYHAARRRAAALAENTGPAGITGARVMVAYTGSTPAEAEIMAYDPKRPNVVKVKYLHSRTAAWVALKRVLGPA